jgi:iron(III) transport system ATP-binding protein
MTLALRDISHGYGTRQILRAVSFEVQPGEFVCLAGESGCGKSTLLRLIAGLEALQNGRIERGGEALSTPEHALPPEKRRIGLVFQHASLFPHLNVRDNVCFGMRPKSREKAHALLEQVRFSGREEDYPHTLSGGEQQRVALARALAAEPELLLLDEPFASLDYDLRKQLRTDIHALLKARGIPTLMVTHDPQEALQLADRIVLLGPQGTVEQIGTPRELYLSPQTEYAARFFGTANYVRMQGTARLVRPEQISLSPQGRHRAVVKRCRFSGSHQLVEMEWEGQALLAKDYELHPLTEGAPVMFNFRFEQGAEAQVV